MGTKSWHGHYAGSLWTSRPCPHLLFWHCHLHSLVPLCADPCGELGVPLRLPNLQSPAMTCLKCPSSPSSLPFNDLFNVYSSPRTCQASSPPGDPPCCSSRQCWDSWPQCSPALCRCWFMGRTTPATDNEAVSPSPIGRSVGARHSKPWIIPWGVLLAQRAGGHQEESVWFGFYKKSHQTHQLLIKMDE